MALPDDCTELEDLTLDSICDLIYKRSEDARKLYSWIGSVLVYVNPFQRSVSEFCTYKRDLYSLCETRREPHIYAVGQRTFNGAIINKAVAPQIVLVTGESGAGKTENCRYLVEYWTNRSSELRQDITSSNIDEKLVKAGVILEAFGSAKTCNNVSSSRFGRFTAVKMNERGEITSAEITPYLLGKSRVTHFTTGEQNFTILHAVAADESSWKQVKASFNLPLDLSPYDYNYLRDDQGHSIENLNIPNHLYFTAVSTALETLQVSEETQRIIWEFCYAILLLGNICYDDDDEFVVIERPETVNLISVVAKLLRVDASKLIAKLQSQQVQDAEKKFRRDRAEEIRDGFARALYEALFHYVTALVNAALGETAAAKTPKVKDNKTLEVVDLYGFEKEPTNSLEQLCVNYANEKLQQLFLVEVIRKEIGLFTEEGIWANTDVSFCENSNCDAIIDALEGPRGFFDALKDAGMDNNNSNKGNRWMTNKEDPRDKTLLAKLQQLNHPCIKVIERRDLRGKNESFNMDFTVAHSFEKLTYSASGFVIQDRGSLTNDLRELLTQSTSQMIKQIWEHRQGKKNGETTAKTYVVQLNCLLKNLREGDLHFVRCVKSNRTCAARTYDTQFMRRQLVYSGFEPFIKVLRHGYPCRMPLADFLKDAPRIDGLEDPDLAELILDGCDTNGLVAVGKTKVFFKENVKAKQVLETAKLHPPPEEEIKRRIERRALIRKETAARKLQKIYRRYAKGRQLLNELRTQQQDRIRSSKLIYAAFLRYKRLLARPTAVAPTTDLDPPKSLMSRFMNRLRPRPSVDEANKADPEPPSPVCEYLQTETKAKDGSEHEPTSDCSEKLVSNAEMISESPAAEAAIAGETAIAGEAAIAGETATTAPASIAPLGPATSVAPTTSISTHPAPDEGQTSATCDSVASHAIPTPRRNELVSAAIDTWQMETWKFDTWQTDTWDTGPQEKTRQPSATRKSRTSWQSQERKRQPSDTRKSQNSSQLQSTWQSQKSALPETWQQPARYRQNKRSTSLVQSPSKLRAEATPFHPPPPKSAQSISLLQAIGSPAGNQEYPLHSTRSNPIRSRAPSERGGSYRRSSSVRSRREYNHKAPEAERRHAPKLPLYPSSRPPLYPSLKPPPYLSSKSPTYLSALLRQPSCLSQFSPIPLQAFTDRPHCWPRPPMLSQTPSRPPRPPKREARQNPSIEAGIHNPRRRSHSVTNKISGKKGRSRLRPAALPECAARSNEEFPKESLSDPDVPPVIRPRQSSRSQRERLRAGLSAGCSRSQSAAVLQTAPPSRASPMLTKCSKQVSIESPAVPGPSISVSGPLSFPKNIPLWRLSSKCADPATNGYAPYYYNQMRESNNSPFDGSKRQTVRNSGGSSSRQADSYFWNTGPGKDPFANCGWADAGRWADFRPASAATKRSTSAAVSSNKKLGQVNWRQNVDSPEPSEKPDEIRASGTVNARLKTTNKQLRGEAGSELSTAAVSPILQPRNRWS